MTFIAKGLMAGIVLNLCLVSGLFSASVPPDDNQALKSMLSELEAKIDDADKRMIAHPNFIGDLRALVQKYKAQLRQLFFRDDFDDANFDKTPEWTVKSGQFSVNSDGQLYSFVAWQAGDEQTGETAQQNKSVEAEAVGIILDSIFGSAQKKKATTQTTRQTQAEPAQPAAIYTRTMFPAAFEMNMAFKSSPKGEFDITLLGTNKLSARYRLNVKADHSNENPIEIIRESGARSFTVGASETFPVINDGNVHTLSWIRYANGAMIVLIDDVKVMQTYEVYYRDDFTGVELTNNKGSHAWDSIEIFKALAPEAD